MTNTYSVAIISLDFTEEITKINNFSFHKIGNIKTLVIRDNVTEIGERAFTGCEKLESVDIPDSVKVINDNMFYLCSGIVNLVIGCGVEEIGEGAFNNIYLLTDIWYSGSAEEWAAITIGNDLGYIRNREIHFDHVKEN